MTDFTSLDAALQNESPVADQSSVDPFASLDAALKQDELTTATAATSNAIGKSPAEHAKNLQLGRKVGLPADMVQSSKPEVERAVKLKSLTKHQLNNPAFVRHMSNPDNAIISQNDAESLSGIENIINAIGAGLHQTVGGVENAGAQLADLQQVINTAAKIYSYIGVGDNKQFADIAANLRTKAAAQNKIGTDVAKSRVGMARVPRVALSGLQSLFPSVTAAAVGLITRRPALGLASFGLPVFGNEAQNGLDQHLDPLSAAVHGAWQAGIEMRSESFAYKPLMNLAKGSGKIVKTLTEFMGKEVVGEEINTIAGNFESWLNLPANANKTFKDFILAIPSNAVDTFIATVAGGGATGALVGGAGAGVNAIHKRQYKKAEAAAFNVADAEAGHASLDAIDHYAKQSETKKLDPETFRKFVNDQDGESKVVLDSEKVNEFLNTKKPEEVQSDPLLQMLDKKLSETIAGENIDMSIADFATDVSGSEHYDELRPHIKLGHESATPFRFEQAVEQSRELVKWIEDNTTDKVSQYVESQDIYNQVKDQIVDTGQHDLTGAKVLAQMVGARAFAGAIRKGISVKEEYESWGLSIEGPQTGVRAMNAARAAAFDQNTLENILKEFDSLGIDTPKDTAQSVFDAPPHERLGRLLNASGLDKTASWNQDRLSRVIDDHAAFDGESSGARVAFVNPADFVNATHPDPQVIANEAGKLDLKKLAGESGTPFLFIQDGEIIGHEGRHRMAALAAAGVSRVPIQVIGQEFSAADTVDENRPMHLKGQFFDTGTAADLNIAESYLAVPANTAMLSSKMAGSDVLFQRGRRPVVSKDEELLPVIRKLGGIKQSLARDILGEKNTVATGSGSLFRKDGLNIDELAQRLQPMGFNIDINSVDGGVAQLKQMIQDSHNDMPHFTAEGQNQREEQRQYDLAQQDQGDFIDPTTQPGYGEPFDQVVPENFAGQVWFEVAPHPDTAEEVQWNKLTLEEKQRVSASILRQFTPAIMGTLGVKGNVVSQLGGWGGQPNPSYAVVLEEQERTQEVMNAFGHIFDQEGMYGVADKPFAGGSPGEMITIRYPDSFSTAQVNKLYRLLWNGIKKDDGDGQIEGFSAHDGAFMTVNQEEDSGISTDDLIKLIDVTLRNTEYGNLDVNARDVHVLYKGKTEDNYGFEHNRRQGDGQPSSRLASTTQGSLDRIRRTALASRSTEVEAVLRGRRTTSIRAEKLRATSREQDGSLRGLPRFRGARHSDQVEQVAREYMESIGMPYQPPTQYSPIDEKRARLIADEYAAMKNDPEDPVVAAAYAAMIKETTAMYKAIMKTGLVVEFVKSGEVYPYEDNPRLMTEDVLENNHMWVFATRDGFGSDEEFNNDKNPLLVDTGFKISGQPATANDLFRVVHDYFGHVKEGTGFRAGGEDNAWIAHSTMFSPLARKAMTSETRGQNSWLNYGPHGEVNRDAKGADTHFADQKVGLLPDWVVNDGLDTPSVVDTSYEQRNALGFYSATQHAVLQMKIPGFKPSKKNPDGEARGADIWAKLKASGLKRDELNLLGIEEFLTIDPNTKFSRESVADFVKENGVNIVEINSEEQSLAEDIVWNEEIDDDPVNYESRVEDFLYDYDNADFQEIIDNNYGGGITGSDLVDIINNNLRVAHFENLPIEAQQAFEKRGESEEAETELMNAMMHDLNVRGDVEDVFTELAREEYMQNPYVTITDTGNNVSILGNDDVGFSIQAAGRTLGNTFDVNEAKDEAINYMIENEIVADNGARWGGHVMDGDHENYREKKLTLPNLEGTFEYDVHFPERNILAFLRVDDRNLMTGQPDEVTPDETVTFTAEVIDNPVKNALVKRVLMIRDNNGDEIFSGGVNNRSEQDAIDTANKVLTTPGKGIGRYRVAADGTMVKQGRRIPKTEKNTYFVDEFQSDWHQQGRKHGYAIGADVGAAALTANAETRKATQLYEQLSEKRKTDEKLANAMDTLAQYVKSGEDIFSVISLAIKNQKIKNNKTAEVARKAERSAVFKVITGVPVLEEIAQHLENSNRAFRVIEAEQHGIPLAPFNDDAWITLGMKRAIMDAIDHGYEAIAWPNSQVLVDRWSEKYRELYENQYDKKMPAIVKRLTGATPIQLDTEGREYEKGDQGYYIIPITDELKQRYSADGFALFQDVRGYYDPSQVLIRLTEQTNPSTFIHEFGHFMLDMEQRSKSDLNVEINKWFGRNTKAIAKEAPGLIRNLINKYQKAIDNKEGDEKFLKAQISSLNSALNRGISAADVEQYLKFGMTGSLGADIGIKRASHEFFARGWEAYVMEGKSPSLEMNTVFRTLARWMTNIYNNVKNLAVNLDPEIRKVFDRLVATEEQIATAEARAKLKPLFTDAVSAGMTEEQFKKYQEKVKAPSDKAAETVRDKLIKEYRRTTTAWWKYEMALLADDEKEKLKETPLYKAIVTLKTGDVKMDRGEVKDKYGVKDKRGRSIIPPKLRGMTVAGGEGAPIDDVAGVFGFKSGDEMIKEIIASPSLTEQAKANAEAEMVKKHGDLLHDGSIEKMADDALENEEKGKLILAELKQLLKGTNQAVIDRRILKQIAEDKIGELSLSKNNPARYRAAEIKAAQDAAVALAAGDKQGAAAAKTQQVMNHFLAVASIEAKNNTLKIVDRLARYRKKKVREAIIRAGNDYMEQIDKILSRFQFNKSATLKSVDKKNQTLAAFIKARQDDGDNIVLDPAVVDETFVTHWKNVPFSDLQGINDSLKNLEHVARYSNKMKLEGEELDFKELAAKFVAHVQQQKARYPRKDTSLISEDVADKHNPKLYLRWAMSHMTKIPFLTSWLDNGERVGMAHDLIMQPFTDSLHNKYELHRSATLPVMHALSARSKEDLKRHNTMVFIPEIKQELRGDQVLAVALNTGNAGNLKKMLLGEGWAKDDSEVSIDNPKLQAILKHLTESDAHLIQLIWDQMDSLYPLLAEVHQRTSGVAPMKVVAVPVTLGGVKLQGGYYPVVYSRARSHNAEKNAERSEAEIDSMFDRSGMVQQSVTAGSTNERTEFNDKVQLSLEVIPNHFEEVIHYITHHDAVAKVNRLISNHDVANAITGVLGEDEYKLLKPWLSDIAKDGRESGAKNFVEKAFQKLRLGTTLGIMGFKASTGIMQILGLFTTAAEFGAGRTTKAVFHVIGRAKYLKAVRRIFGSTTDMESAWEFAVARSKVLKHRTDTMDREINAANRQLKGKGTRLAALQEASMKHIALIQTYAVDLPTWHAAYDAELEKSGDPDKAERHGDWAVENLQGSGAVKDMSAIMRNQSKVFTTLMMFMTFFSSLWNLTRETGRQIRGTTQRAPVTTMAAKIAFLFVVPVIAEMLLRGEFGDGDDEDEQLQAMLLKIALYPTTGIPFVRDIANGIGKYKYNFSPVTSTLTKGLEGLDMVWNAAMSDDKEVTLSQVKNVSKLAGAVVGIPGTSQAWATGEHLHDVLTEGEDLTLQELVYGPKR